MPVNFRIRPEANLVVFTVTGHIEVADIQAAFDRMLEDPDFRPGMNALWDLREALVYSTPAEIQELITHVALSRERRGSRYRLAIVAQDSVLLMLADIFKALASPLPSQVKICQDFDEAWNWLQSDHGGNTSVA